LRVGRSGGGHHDFDDDDEDDCRDLVALPSEVWRVEGGGGSGRWFEFGSGGFQMERTLKHEIISW
jgi:hypothetical protein